MSQPPLQQETHDADDLDAPIWTPRLRQRLLLAGIAALCLVLLVVVPPYISVSRYQRRVAAAISGALGRPVHFDAITLHLLPLPGLTIQNFVVSESPEFGSEPVLRANTVEARLRIASLWRRRVEVSHISLDAPSINLVHRREDDRWNLQSILMQASQMNSAPTAQTRAGSAPRFPYIEATEARINLKNGIDKLPFAVKEASFALWLPEPGQWRLRVSGKPVRTDTDVNDVGLLRVEGSLGRAADLSNATIDLAASWKPTPMGEAGKLTVGHDLHWRGEASAQASLHGTLGQARLSTDLHLLALRREEFVPEHTAEINAHCEAVTAGLLRSLHDVRCAIPTNSDTSIFSAIEVLRRLPEPSPAGDLPESSARPGVLLLRGEVPNVLDGRSITGSASLSGASASYGVAWAHVFWRGIPHDLSLGGTFNLTASTAAAGLLTDGWSGNWTCECVLPQPATGTAAPSRTTDAAPVPAKAVTPNRWSIALHHDPSAAGATATLLAYPNPAAADGKPEPAVPMVPATSVISGQVSRTGYTLIFGSESSATTATQLIPPLGQGMPVSASGALQTQRVWGSAPSWTAATSSPRKPEPRRRR